MSLGTLAGAILASGRSGRETILWTEQKEFFDKKNLFYVFKPIWRKDLSEVLFKIQQIKTFEEASGLFWSINWEKGQKKRVGV